MRCKDFDKLIHLFLDQKLDEQKKKEIEDHLSECPRCKEKFEALKLVEEKARGIEIPEPEDAYWESFSRRVREKIVSKQKQPFGAKVKGFFANIFVFTPTRLKIAAAVASIVLVFIVGKLYIDYRGTIPETIKYAEKEIPSAETPEFKKEEPVPVSEKPPPSGEEKEITERKAPETKKGVIKEEKREKPAPEIKAEPKEMEAGAGVEVMAKKKAPRDVGKKAPIPEIMEQEVAKPVEKAEPAKGAMRTFPGIEQKEKLTSRVRGEGEAVLPDGVDSGVVVSQVWIVDKIKVPDVEFFKEKLSADSLRVIIDFWSKFIKDNPEDIFVESAYLQIAASYYYLFDKTKDEALRQEGIKQIEEFQKISKEEETKKSLRQRLEKLKCLKGK